MKYCENYDIDAVILWVNGSDPKWLKEKNKYKSSRGQDANTSRYRDWETLIYIFRGISQFAPWIRKVHFVTCGQIPEWLNVNCKKLNIVNHEDFIPKKYLPTFSSQSIDLNLHRITGLAEHFIYFNDDMFLTSRVKPIDFFVKGMPRDMFSERPLFWSEGVFSHNMMNNIEMLSVFYDRREVLKKNISKVLNIRYGKTFFYNFLWFFFPFKKFSCLYINHLPMSYRKEQWETVWKLNEKKMNDTIQNKFRTITDLNQFVFNYYALMEGNFYPTNMDKQGKCFRNLDNLDEICLSIEKQKYKRICINDECSDEVYEIGKKKIIDAFNTILGDKSEFEK